MMTKLKGWREVILFPFPDFKLPEKSTKWIWGTADYEARRKKVMAIKLP